MKESDREKEEQVCPHCHCFVVMVISYFHISHTLFASGLSVWTIRVRSVLAVYRVFILLSLYSVCQGVYVNIEVCMSILRCVLVLVCQRYRLGVSIYSMGVLYTGVKFSMSHCIV